MPEDEGVLGSTADDSTDIALLNEEDNVSQVETKEPESRAPKPESEETEIKVEEPERIEPPKEVLYDRPSIKEISEAFPEFFTKFPALKDMYFREQEFSSVFPTIDEAKEASANAQAFNDLSSKVLNGDTASLFNAVKTADEKAFGKMIEGLLPTVYKMSPELHWKATLPLTQNLVRAFYLEGEKRRNEDIMNSAQHLSDFLFGDVGVAKGERNLLPKKESEESEEAQQLKAERQLLNVEKYTNFFNGIKSKADEEISRTILERGEHNRLKIDPDNVFSDFIRDMISKKTYEELENQLKSDKAHMKYINSLWNRAKESGYNEEWKSKILSAYLARAKPLIPKIRAKFVSEAMGTSSRVNGFRKEIQEKNLSRREPGAGGRTSSEVKGPIDAKKVDWSKTSDMDLLEDRVTYKN